MSSEDSSRPVPHPWAHRSRCAPDCDFRPGAAEGTHLSRLWALAPDEEAAERVAVRLAETQPGPEGRRSESYGALCGWRALAATLTMPEPAVRPALIGGRTGPGGEPGG